jgi:DNA repair protein RadA/Sms
VDHNRVALLTAILEKHGGLHLNSLDIFVNVAGGFKLVEPAADLAVSMALVSSFRNKSLPLKMAMFGEIGLTGEVRAVSQAEARIHEAIKLGFTQVMLPENNRKRIKSIEGVELIGVRTVDEMLSFFSS